MRKWSFGAVALAAVALSVVFIGSAGAAKPSPTTANGCPNGGTYLVDPDVGASSMGGITRTYMFNSWVDKDPDNGVPGLVGYCVFADAAATAVNASAKGENGQTWKASKPGKAFSYTRPVGDKSNIGLDGEDTVMGTATFGTVPSSQTILLHVSDAAKCQELYGGDATTCFVLPSEEPETGPVCDAAGDINAAYNAIPKDVQHCAVPSLGFEAEQTNEFGDLVELDTSAGNNVQSMTVDFQSFGCGDSGHWNTADCVTTLGEAFTVPGGITANIYAPDDLTAPIATSNIDPNIPFRPTADPLCTGADAGKWFDSASGACRNSLSVPLTFDFAGEELPDTVVWTVQFNTSTEGYDPIGLTACSVVNPSDAGCGYDSLNVGVKNYAPDAFAGVDVDNDVAYRSFSGNSDTLEAETGWADLRPLGQIVTGP